MQRWALFLLLVLAQPAAAAESWLTSLVEKPKLPAGIVAQPLEPAPGGIAGMLTAVGSAQSDIARAWYSQSTSRYRHGALGDKIEGGALVVERADGRRFTYRLGEIEVFEDLYPRIADLDGDGKAEVTTILSSLARGSSIAIFGLNGDTLVKKASTPHIGRPFRWLNIAGIDRFTGARTPEIAFVATPHIGGKLAFLRYQNGEIQLIAAQSGFSNHAMGSTELRLSAIADVNGDNRADLAVPAADRKSLRIMAFSNSGLVEIGRARLPAPIDKAIAVSGSGRQTVFTVGLEDGRVYEVRR